MSSSNGESVVDESMEIGEQDNNGNKNENIDENKTQKESGSGSGNKNETINENKTQKESGSGSSINENISENIKNTVREKYVVNKTETREGTSVNSNENILENIENTTRENSNENKNEIRERISVNANKNKLKNIENMGNNNKNNQNMIDDNEPEMYPLSKYRSTPTDIYTWDRKANTSIRKFLLRESVLKYLEPILTYYWKKVNKCFQEDLYRHYNLCVSLSRNMLRLCFFSKLLLESCNSSINYAQISLKLCNILVNYTELQLRIGCRFDNSSMSIASRITNAYDLFLGSGNKALILHVLLQIRYFNKQYELFSRIFAKYLEHSEQNMPDRLYLLHVFAIRKWKSILADDTERENVTNIAYNLKPMRPLCENKELLQLLHVDKRHCTSDKNIISYIFSRQNHKHSIYWSLISGNELNSDTVVFNLTEDDDKILDQLQYVFPYGDNNAIIVEEPQFPSNPQNQRINRVQVKMEQPEIIDIIDLTNEKRDDLFYLKNLVKNVNSVVIRNFTIMGTIVLDDDEARPISSTISNNVESMEVTNEISNESNVNCVESNLNCNNIDDDDNNNNFEKSEKIQNVENKNLQKTIRAAAENIELDIVSDSNKNLCECVEAININSEDQTQHQQKELLKSTNIANIETVKEIDKLPQTEENKKSISVQNEKPKPTQNEESLSIQNKEPMSTQNEEPMSTQNEESLSIQNEKPMSTQNEESISVQNEEPMSTENEESISIQNEKPTSTQNEELISIQNEKPKPTQNEESLSIQNKEPMSTQNEEPMSTQNEESLSIQNEKPMITQNEESIGVQNEEPMSTENEESISMQNEKPMSTQNKELISIQNEKPMSIRNEESLSVPNKEPMSTKNEEFISTQNELISIQNEEPMSTQNKESLSMQNEKPMITQNEESISVQNEEPMSTQNEESLSVPNEKPMITQNEESIGVQNEEPMSTENEESISIQNEKSMSTQNEESLSIPNKEPISTQNEEFISTQNEAMSIQNEEPISIRNEESLSIPNKEPMSTQNEEFISTQDEEFISTQNESISIQNKEPMSTQNKESISIQNEKPMSTQKEELISIQNEKPMSIRNEESLSVPNKEPMSTKNEEFISTQNELISIQNEEPMSTQNEESLSIQNEEAMSTKNEEFISTQNELISIQNEEAMSTQNGESISIQNEKPMSTQNEESISIQNEKSMSTQNEESLSIPNKEPMSTSNEELISIQNKELISRQNKELIVTENDEVIENEINNSVAESVQFEKEISLPQSLQVNNVESEKDNNDMENTSNTNTECENDKQNTDEFLCNSLEEEESLVIENNSSLDVHNFLFKDILQTNVCNSELNESIMVKSSVDRINEQSSPDLYLFRDHQEDLDNYSTTVVDKPNLYDDNLSEEYDDEIKSIAQKITIPVLKTYERKKKSQISNKTIEMKISNDANNVQITHNSKNLHMVDNTNLQFEQTTHIKDNIGLDPPVFSPFSSEECSRSSSPIDILNESVNQDINNLDNDMIIPLIKNTTNKNVHSENNVVFSAVATKRLEVKKWKDPMEMSSNVSAQPNIIFSTDRFSTLQQKEFNQISKIYDNVPVEKAPNIVETIINSQEECDEIRSPPVECFTESDAHEICDLIGKDWSDSNLNKHRKNIEELRKNVYYKQDDEHRRFNNSTQSISQNLSNVESRENQVYNLNINEDLTPNDLSTRALKRKSVTFADTTQERNIIKIVDNPPTSQILDRKTYEPLSVQQIPEWNSPINKTFNQSTHYHSLPINQHSTLPNNQSNTIFQHLDTSSNYDAPPKSLSTSIANSGTKNLDKLCKTMDMKSHSRISNNRNNKNNINNLNNHISRVKNIKNKNEIVLRSNSWKLTNVSISRRNSIQYDNIFSSKSNNINLNKTVINKNDNSVIKDISNNLSKQISNENRTIQNTSNIIDNKMVSDFDKYLRSKKNLKSKFDEKTKKNKYGRKNNMNIQNKKLKNSLNKGNKNNKKTSDISVRKNLFYKKLLYSFKDKKLLKKTIIKLIPVEYDSSLSSLEIVSSFKRNILNKDFQVKVLNNYDNTNNLSKMITNHVFIQTNKKKNSHTLIDNENYHSFVKLKRIKLISNVNNDDNNQQKNIEKNSTINKKINKGQEEDNNQNQNTIKRYDKFKNNCKYNISNIDSLVKTNNNIINRECNYDIDTSVSSSVFHYSIDQNERYDVDDREEVCNMNIEEDSISISGISVSQISSNINSKTKNIHNNYDDIIHENEVSSSQDTSCINNDIDDINNVVSSSTVEQSEFVQNNQIDSSNPSILHRISGGTRRKTILIDHNDLLLNNTTNAITELNDDTINNTPTTTTKDVYKPSQNRKRGRPRKHNQNINNDNAVEKPDVKLLSKKEKRKLKNTTDKNNSSSYLSKNYLIRKKTNAKTYSNCHIQKIFVPPEVEQIIEENVSKNETTSKEISTVITTNTTTATTSSSSVFGFSTRKKYRYK